jgi:hypothetical protein
MIDNDFYNYVFLLTINELWINKLLLRCPNMFKTQVTYLHNKMNHEIIRLQTIKKFDRV